MLVPAVLYKDEIYKRFLEYNYSDDMIYYAGYLGSSLPNLDEECDGSLYQYAIVENGRLIGYFSYRIDWYASCVYNFGLFAFDRNNKILGIDVIRELKKIINDYHIHRLEWRMIGGNTVEKHYDNFCKKYNGRKIILKDVVKDRCGKYHDDVIYEIIFESEE